MYSKPCMIGPLIVAAIVALVPHLAPNSQTKETHMGTEDAAFVARAQPAANTHPRQPGQAEFRSVLPEDIEWKPFAAFPPSVCLAVVVGEPSAPGLYVIRVKVPSGVKLMPHRHPEDRIYTVISGVFYIGFGEKFDADKLHAYPPGSVIVLPRNTPHYHLARSGEYVTQVTAIGPLGIKYVNLEDDPRNQGRTAGGKK
jgi:quercetin dioxygenase-like cupin family protein